MSWLEENKGAVGTVVAVAVVAYFAGGFATARRHRGAIARESAQFKLAWTKVQNDFKALKAADKALRRSHGRGWLSGAVLGSESARATQQLEARKDLVVSVSRLRGFEDEWSTSERSKVRRFAKKLKKQNPLAYGHAFPELAVLEG